MRAGTSFYIQTDEQFVRKVGKVAATHGNSFRGVGFYDAEDGALHGPNRTPDRVCAPYIVSDYPAHISSVSGRVINSRSDQRDEFKRTNTQCWDDCAKQPRGYINEEFCRKRGLKTSPDAQQHWANITKGIDDALQGKPKITKPHKTDPNKLSRKVRNEIVGALEANGL